MREDENEKVKQELRDNLIHDEGEFLDDLREKLDEKEEMLEDKRNRVLEMQVDDAFNRGKDFQDRMTRDGASAKDMQGIMNELEGKM